MEEESKLQFSQPDLSDDKMMKLKVQVLESLALIEREDPDTTGTVEMVADTLGIRDQVIKEVKVSFSLNFTVAARTYPYLQGLSEEEFLEQLVGQIIVDPEMLPKYTQSFLWDNLNQESSAKPTLLRELTLEVNSVQDMDELEAGYAAAADEEPTADEEELTEDEVPPHQQVPLTLRPSGLPTILDADSDPYNRVLGMEFDLGQYRFKAAFANAHGTVTHLFRKQGKRWLPLCNRSNAKTTNGISVQSSRDARSWCQECERRFANKLPEE